MSRRYSVHVLAVTALSSLILPGVAAQDTPSTQPMTISPTPAPTCRLDVLGPTSAKSAKIERDAGGALWIASFETRTALGSNAQQINSYRTDVPLDIYIDGKKMKMPKGSNWHYSGRAAFTYVRGRIAPDAKMEKALRTANAMSVRYKGVEVAAVALTGLNDAMPVDATCPETTEIARSMAGEIEMYGPNRAAPILPEQSPAQCEVSSIDAKTYQAVRIGGGPRERKNMTLQLVGPFNGPIDANGHYWLPEDGGMQLLVDGKAFALPDEVIMGRSEGANFAQMAVTVSDSDPLFAALKKAKTVAVRVGKSEVYRYVLPKKHTLFTESAACFQPERDAIAAANAAPNQRLAPKGNPSNWVPQSAYPRTALREMREGTVGFMLVVDKFGYAEECRVTSTSGHPELDMAACSNLMKRARFNPATDAKGQLQRSTYSNRVRWVIPQ